MESIFASVLGFLSSYWMYVALLFCILFFKKIIEFFGIIIIPENKMGLVIKKFVLFGPNRSLAEGKIIAINGEAGMQADTLAPGIYFGYWPWQYKIEKSDFTIIKSGNLGTVIARDGLSVPVGSILAKRIEGHNNFQDAKAFLENGGQKGKQVAVLLPGTYRINEFLFEVDPNVPITPVSADKVGIVTTLDGAPIPAGKIAGPPIEGHNNFQDMGAFLEGGGCRGLQTQVILSGSYCLNPWALKVKEVDMTSVEIGHVGVVISYVGEDGEDVSGEEFKHGNIVKKGHKGVWETPLDPGKYPINTFTQKIESVPTTNIVLNWANGRNESHNLDSKLSTISVRSKDGFNFNLDVSQIINIPSKEAAKVIARFGSVNNLVSQVLEPTIGNYFRNSAQESDVIDFLKNRQERQACAKQKIVEVLATYNVSGIDTLIGDIVPPEGLMKTLTDRKIAEEQTKTYTAEMQAQITREQLQKQTAISDMQPELVKADQNVTIAGKNAESAIKKAEGEAAAVKLAASAEANRIEITGGAEAKKISAIGSANAEAYEKQVKAMGQDNFGKLKVVEEIGRGKVKITPEILVNGGGNGGSIDALLGLTLADVIRAGKKEEGKNTKEVVPVADNQ